MNKAHTARGTDQGAPRGRTAWDVVQSPLPRSRYQHESAYKRRESKRDSFRRKLRLTDGGCWLWTSSTVIGAGKRQYPIFNHRRELTPDNTTRAAFNWMMQEWFPDVDVPAYTRTSSECGNSLCLSPYHRYINFENGGKGKPRMDHRRVLDIYSWRGKQSAASTAELFEVHVSTVERIWNGTRWSSVTGHRRDGKTPPMDATRARAIFADRNSGLSQQQVADKHGTSRVTVRSIWYGHTWSTATGAEYVQPDPRILSEQTRSEIIRRKGTAPARRVAVEFGVSSSTVLRIWDKLDLPRQQTPC